jgi:hypothetical protein
VRRLDKQFISLSRRYFAAGFAEFLLSSVIIFCVSYIEHSQPISPFKESNHSTDNNIEGIYAYNTTFHTLKI